MILGSHQNSPTYNQNENQGNERPPRDTQYDHDPEDQEDFNDGHFDDGEGNGKGKGSNFDPIKAGSYYALLSFVHLLLLDLLANEEGDQYYETYGKNKAQSHNQVLARDIFSEVPPSKSLTSLNSIRKFNKWNRQKRSMGGRLRAPYNPYDSDDADVVSADDSDHQTSSQEHTTYDDDWYETEVSYEYGYGYELMMLWHNLAFMSVQFTWMASHFLDFMYEPFIMSVKLSLLGPKFFYWVIFAALLGDAAIAKFDVELIIYAFIYLALAVGTTVAQKIFAGPIFDDYNGDGEYCDPEHDDDCCDPEVDSDCEYEFSDYGSEEDHDDYSRDDDHYGYDSDVRENHDSDYDYDEDCEKGDTWCEDKHNSKNLPESQPETHRESQPEAEPEAEPEEQPTNRTRRTMRPTKKDEDEDEEDEDLNDKIQKDGDFENQGSDDDVSGLENTDDASADQDQTNVSGLENVDDDKKDGSTEEPDFNFNEEDDKN